MICLGHRNQVSKLSLTAIKLGGVDIQQSNFGSDLGIISDENLSMSDSDHINIVACSSFHQLWQLSAVVALLTTNAATTLVHGTGCFSERLMSKYNALNQSKNATALFITGTSCMQHITPALQILHWLPVWHQISLKIIYLVEKCLWSSRLPLWSVLLVQQVRPYGLLSRHLYATTQSMHYIFLMPEDVLFWTNDCGAFVTKKCVI